MQKHIALVAMFAWAYPVTAIAGVFYNNTGAFISEHPHDAMASASLVRVKPGTNARFYLHTRENGCPMPTDACKALGYLVHGDIAVAAYTIGAFTIVEFTGSNGKQTEGAIESRLLERVQTPKPTPQDWIGHWQDTDERDIVVSQTSDPSVLGFLGNAMSGSHDPRRAKIGAVNLGFFAAYVTPATEWGGFVVDLGSEGETDFKFPAILVQKGINTDWTHYFPVEAENAGGGPCRASFRLLGPYLIAYTPLYICGGMNVTFTGVYHRVAPRHGEHVIVERRQLCRTHRKYRPVRFPLLSAIQQCCRHRVASTLFNSGLRRCNLRRDARVGWQPNQDSSGIQGHWPIGANITISSPRA